jgi:hypothetical protein
MKPSGGTIAWFSRMASAVEHDPVQILERSALDLDRVILAALHPFDGDHSLAPGAPRRDDGGDRVGPY